MSSIVLSRASVRRFAISCFLKGAEYVAGIVSRDPVMEGRTPQPTCAMILPRREVARRTDVLTLYADIGRDGAVSHPQAQHPLTELEMRRLTKWIVISLIGLVGILVVAVEMVYALSSLRMRKTYVFKDAPITIRSDSVSLLNGHHFVQAIAKCAVCHGDDFAGKVIVENAAMGRLYAANITRGKG